MLRLLLYRHAKSDWGDPALDDIDRTLNSRGRAAARAMAAYVAKENLLPDLILCSTAQRTRETLAKLMPHLNRECEVRLRRDLYWQGEDSYQTIIRGNGGTARTLMVIGHNPAMHDLFTMLATGGDPLALERLTAKFPTAALAVMSSEATSWRDIAVSGATVTDRALPRDLLQEQ